MVPLDELEVQMLLASFQSVLPTEKSGRRNSTLDFSLHCNFVPYKVAWCTVDSPVLGAASFALTNVCSPLTPWQAWLCLSVARLLALIRSQA
jgi:hypothetical protein